MTRTNHAATTQTQLPLLGGSAPVPPELHRQAVPDAVKFLARICNRRAFAKPYLILDALGGHFAKSLDFPLPQ